MQISYIHNLNWSQLSTLRYAQYQVLKRKRQCSFLIKIHNQNLTVLLLYILTFKGLKSSRKLQGHTGEIFNKTLRLCKPKALQAKREKYWQHCNHYLINLRAKYGEHFKEIAITTSQHNIFCYCNNRQINMRLPDDLNNIIKEVTIYSFSSDCLMNSFNS